MIHFKQEYHVAFIQDERMLLLNALAREYHERTEAYDQQICSGRTKRGVAIPVNSYQRYRSEAYARRVLTDLRERYASIDEPDLVEAILGYSPVFEADWESGLYERLKCPSATPL